MPTPHMPIAQVAVALAAAQARPQDMQLEALTWVSTQAPPQHDRPPAQGRCESQPCTQRSSAQTLPAGQSALRRHSTQRLAAVSQRRAGTPASPTEAMRQPWSLRQPATQVLVMPSQCCVGGQLPSKAGVHCTHWLVAVLQMR